MKRTAVVVLVVLLAATAAWLALAANAQDPPPSLRKGQSITICHATGNGGFTQNSVDRASILNGQGHGGHENDIIPPFIVEDPDPGEPASYPGKNWDDRGQAIWAMDCAPKDVTPLLACVEATNTGLVAHFGYRSGERNPVTIHVGPANMFTPGDANRNQPITFEPGTHNDVVAVPFDGSLEWRLSLNSVTASEGSPRCGGSIRIDKALDPIDDPGRFDLLLDGQVRKAGVGNSGTTGTMNVNAGQHTVSEVAAAGTNLANYTTSIVCRDNGGSGAEVAQGLGTSLVVPVARGQAIACVILNARQKPPRPGQADLKVVKSASPRSLHVGEKVTWTVTVTNIGPDVATHVVIEDSLPDDVSFVEGSLVVPPDVICVGARCTIASLAAGASRTGRFVTTVTNVGRKTNTVTVTADQEDVNPANNAASAVVDVTGGAKEVVRPILECVDQLSDGNYRAHFGYLNDGNASVTVPIGRNNAFTPSPEDRGQPRQFRPGRAPDVFQVDFQRTLVWTLTGRTSTASQSSKRCAPTTGWLRVDKVLRPENDPGRFNLEINGVPAGTGRNVGHLGTTGDVSVPAGRHRVGEEGVGGTSLADYEITIVCRADRGRGAVLSQYQGSSELVVDVAAGQEVVCTISNTRRTGPPVPPLPPPPGPTPGPGPIDPTQPPQPPPPGSTDLAVQKFVERRVAALGTVVTWTVVVTNNGPEAATGVVATDQAAAGATFVSFQVSQGTCNTTRTTCSLGTIPPGGSVRAVARTRMLRVGARLNTVGVRGDQPDSVPENNVASALIRIVSSFAPPLAQRCDRISVNRRVARAGTTVPVRVAVRSVLGRPLVGTVVRARGAGQQTSATTNARGIARHPARADEAGHRPVHGRGAGAHRCPRDPVYRKAWRRGHRRPRSRRHRRDGLGNDVDRRPDGRQATQADDVLVSHPDAAVRDGLADQLRQAGSVDADDAAPRPVAEARVGARLEGERPVERIDRREPPLHVEVAAERRRRLRRADRDGRTENHLAVFQSPHLQPARGPADDDPVLDRAHTD